MKVLIPVYNGESILEETIKEIKKLDYLDICVFIDDSSTDGTAKILRSWESLLAGVYHMERNGQKVGSIKKVLEEMRKKGELPKHVVLTDADTFIYNHNSKEALQRAVDYMESQKLVAIGLMDVPYRNHSLLQKLQYWEYLSDRAMHNILSSRGYMRCIPGAGGIYQADVLLKALQSHSLRHAGDDMEVTALVQKLGYKVGYYNKDLEVRTRVPHSFGSLIKQRVRWTVGALETYIKEWRFYAKRAGRNRHGWQILYEMVKLLTYGGWYWALYIHPVRNFTIGWAATFALSWVFVMVNPESAGQRVRATVWMLPTSCMIYIVDTIRLPVAYAQVAYNLFPRLEVTTSWTDAWRLLIMRQISGRT